MDVRPNVSQFKKFFGLGPAMTDEKKSLLTKQASGSFGNHQISLLESEEKPVLQSLDENKNGLAVALAAAQLSHRADSIKVSVDSCKPEESHKRGLLSKAEAAYNKAAMAKGHSDTEDNVQSEAWDNISLLYENAGSLFEESSGEPIERQEAQEKTHSAEMLMKKADGMKQKLQVDSPSSIEPDDDDKKEKCVIS
jgi:hypothetical protein